MKAKEYLRQVRKLDKMIKNKLIEKQQWMDVALSITGQLNDEKVKSSGNQQRTASAIEKCIDLEREIEEHIDNLIDKKREILGVIEQLKPDEYDLIHAYYIQFMTLEDAAYSLGKSYTWATTVHGRALNSVQAIIDRKANNEEY